MREVKEHWMQLIERKQLCEYDRQKVSGFLSHFTADTVVLEEDYIKNFLLVIQYLITGVASLVMVWYIHYYFVIFIALTAWLPLLVNHLWAGRITEAKLEASRGNGAFTRCLQELLAGFEVSRMYGISHHIYKNFQKENQELESKRFWGRWSGNAAESCSGTASLFIWLGTLLLGVFLVIRQVLTVGKTIQVSQLLNHVVNPLYRISACRTSMKAAEEIFRQVEGGIMADEQPQELREKRTKELPPFSEAIQFTEVGILAGERRILKGINLRFEKGKKYLITGESGCGKSTLLRLLLDYYKEYEGQITIDGELLSEIRPESLYAQTAVVSQNDFLFHDTLRHNLLLFRQAQDETLHQVLKLCCLENFVNLHKEGLDFILEENGKNVSGGERQRICLARALLKSSPILVLDEASSALDAHTARRIEEGILNLPELTVIAVSHKLFPELLGKYDGVIRLGAQQKS